MLNKVHEPQFCQEFAKLSQLFANATKFRFGVFSHQINPVFVSPDFDWNKFLIKRIIEKSSSLTSDKTIYRINNQFFVYFRRFVNVGCEEFYLLSAPFISNNEIESIDIEMDEEVDSLNRNEIDKSVILLFDENLNLYEKNKNQNDDVKRYQDKFQEANKNYLKQKQKKSEIERDYLESEARYKKLTNATFEGIIIHDDGLILDSNKVVNKMLGYEGVYINGTNFADYICNEQKAKAKEFVGGYSNLQSELRLIKKDGQCVETELFSKPFIFKGRTVKVMAIRDITQRKKTEKELIKRLQSEKDLSMCSQILLSNKENAFEETLKHLLKTSSASRVYLYENYIDKNNQLAARLIHNTCHAGCENSKHAEIGTIIYNEAYPEFKETLNKGDYINSITIDFPTEMACDLSEYEVLAVLVIPVFVNQEWYGFIGFSDIENERVWHEDDIRMLQTVARMVGWRIEQDQFSEALIKSERKYKELIEKMNEGFVTVGPDGLISYANKKLSEMFGYPAEEMVGKSLKDYTEHAEDENFDKIADEKCEEDTAIEMDWVHADGDLISTIVSPKSLYAEDGEMLGSFAILTDISKQKKAEQLLNEKNRQLERKIQELNFVQEKMREARLDQQKFVSLVENSFDFIAISDLDLNVTYMNPAGIKLLGVDETDIHINLLKTECPEKSEEFLRKKREQLIKSVEAVNKHGVWRGELTHVNYKTKKKIYMHATSFMIREPHTKKPLFYATIQRDITDLKKIQQQLDEKNKMLNENMDKLRDANEELIASEEELRQNTEELRTNNEYLEKVRLELEVMLKNEQEMKEQLNKTLNELQTAQLQLVEKEKMASLGQLTAGIAHEINNPINFVSSNVSPLKLDLGELKILLSKYRSINENDDLHSRLSEIKDYEDQIEPDFLFDEVDTLLKGIEEGAKRTKEIVLGLRNFSRLDENEFKRININESIDTTLMLLTNKIKNKVEIRKDYCQEAEIECIPGKINQVFMNILTNGIQAIEQKGVLNIRTQSVDKHVIVRIKDNGRGMPEQVKSRIFEPFFTTKEVGKGTGLGLSITYGIIEKHNGTIEVNSEEGEGTEFIISFPKIQKY